MNILDGRTVRLFLVDGTPNGISTAEIINFTGHALSAPRSRLGEVLERPEASRTGIYFLIGEDPDEPDRMRVYIGEADNVAKRIRNHVKKHPNDNSKEFWTRFCSITSKDSNLTKAHVRYLESRLIELAKSAERANLANFTDPGPKLLPESDVADMEVFLTQIQLLLPIFGMTFLQPRAKGVPTLVPPAFMRAASPSGKLDLELVSDKHDIHARAVEIDGEFTVLAGSQATTNKFAQNSYQKLRDQLKEEGKLKEVPNEPLLEFKQDVIFKSPSAAASVIKNRNTNGRESWKIAGTSQTLKQWQDAQLESAVESNDDNSGLPDNEEDSD